MPIDLEAIRKRDDDFWREIIYTDGKLDEESVLKELADYSFLLSQVPLVYDHITGGRMSKVMYCAKDVIAQHDDVDTAERDEAFNEGKGAGKQDALAELTTARAMLAENARLRVAGEAVVAARDAFQAAWDICPYDSEGKRNIARSDALIAASDQANKAEEDLRAALVDKP